MLNIIIDYFIQNWTWLLPLIVSVVESVLIILLKRRPVFNLDDRYWRLILESLPYLIREAEQKCTTSYDKMAYVLNDLICRFPDIFNDSVKLTAVKGYIESILMTPQKKGGN